MAILQVVGFALVVVALLVVLRQERPELAVLAGAAAGIVILVTLLDRLNLVLDAVAGLAARAGLEPFYLGTVLRIIGVAYLAEFGAQVCRDAGEGALAHKVELAGKVLILVLAVPVILAVLDLMLRMVP